LPGTRRLLREFFGYSLEELIGPPRISTPSAALITPATSDMGRIVRDASSGSLDFLSWAEADRVAPSVLEHISSELQRIATEYVHRPMPPLFRDLIDLRDSTFRLLRERPHPKQARELFFVGGVVCTLLAHASQNLGHSSAARIQAATAWACAEQADHGDLRAWVRGTQALIAEWSDAHEQAVAFTREAHTYARSTESRVRLAAIEARTLARAGDANGAIVALEFARRIRNTIGRADSLAEYGGILTFPYVKQQYYAGSTLALAGRYESAERTALEAIQIYEAGPEAQRSYGDLALARVDIAVARSELGDVDGALVELQPVFDLPPDQRIRQIANGLDRLRRHLTQDRYRECVAAQALRDQIAAFTDVPGAASHP
jgi:tetratricopeptide (TPR) repeat protein